MNQATGSIEAQGDRYALRMARRLAAKIQDVWSALTEPDEIGGWLAPTRLEPEAVDAPARTVFIMR